MQEEGKEQLKLHTGQGLLRVVEYKFQWYLMQSRLQCMTTKRWCGAEMMGAHAHCPVALVESGVGRIRVVHMDRSGQGRSRAFQAQRTCTRYINTASAPIELTHTRATNTIKRSTQTCARLFRATALRSIYNSAKGARTFAQTLYHSIHYLIVFSQPVTNGV